MTVTLRHLFGEYTRGGSSAIELGALYDELVHADGEHTDVGVQDERGWSLSAFAGGLVIFENVEDEGDAGPRHMRGVERDHVLRLWQALVRGDLGELEKEAWRPGYR